MKREALDYESKDLISFIGLSLLRMHDTVEETVRPWEKRDYWLKADRFRMDWRWTKEIGDQVVDYALNDNWDEITSYLAQISQHLSKVNVSPRHRMGTPWKGAYKELQKTEGE
jgi:hypothetical protein